mmetsp:Transcript_32322/g.52214  ORF Transcript_32322/g.52214 Transcript_32322/m.52214 type:complete len:122 (-) Transcript_32322:209-574(-)|eukprot:CAMPEP_0184659928 /NCGR_PEP_ID=MMETSP0308-20130426/31734_1 /TAXON_ID=38269 /ORGANISM="Gloeochaete witrockiana, Strain SAG 46.84" /LENGTH=121 /DNA_ID=CAMNT_0027100141 /DNA_START=187 /DNA_END=552 /DNA_ORIENTATION=-
MAAFVTGVAVVPSARFAVSSTSKVCATSSRRQLSFAASPSMGDNNIAFFNRKFEAVPAAVTALPASAMTISASKKPEEGNGAGFTFTAETLNGRLAMLGFVAALLTEVATGEGTLHFLHLL